MSTFAVTRRREEAQSEAAGPAIQTLKAVAQVVPRMDSHVQGRAFVPSMLPETPTPVMFWASWCGYCRTFRQEFDDIPGGVIVDVTDEDDPAWDIWNIRLVPTVVLFKEQEPTKRWVGVLGKKHADEIRAAMRE